MHFLISLGLAVVLLYCWLTVHWIARVLMTIVLAPAVGAVLALMLGGLGNRNLIVTATAFDRHLAPSLT
jgi:hypothetical protein